MSPNREYTPKQKAASMPMPRLKEKRLPPAKHRPDRGIPTVREYKPTLKLKERHGRPVTEY